MSKFFIKESIKRPGALRKKFGVKKGQKIPAGKLSARRKALMKKAAGAKKLSSSELRELRQINLAKTLAKLRKRK